jgi:hypothetical protein
MLEESSKPLTMAEQEGTYEIGDMSLSLFHDMRYCARF